MIPFGVICLPVGLLLFFFKDRKYLFWATVACVPLYEAYVIDLSVTKVRVFHYFGLLLILRQTFELLISKRYFKFVVSRTTAAMIVFVVCCYMSLFMPFIFENKIDILTIDTFYRDYDTLVPLQFSVRNVTQVIYPTFMVIFFVSLLYELSSIEIVNKLIKRLIYFSLIIIMSGFIFQGGLLFIGYKVIDFALYFFWGLRDSSTVFPLQYNAYSDAIGDLPRMFSLAGEPGDTTLYLVFILGLLGTSALYFQRGKCKPKGWHLVLVLIMVPILVGGSTSGYLGIVTFFLATAATAFIGSRKKRLYYFSRFLLYGFPLLIFIFALLFTSFSILSKLSIREYLYQVHFLKLAGEVGSGTTRVPSILHSLEIFFDSPILGVGYGSHRSGSLITALLSNVGIVGLLLFMYFNMVVLFRTFKVCRNSHNVDLIEIASILSATYMTVFPVMLLKRVAVIIFGWYWLLLAMMEACHRLYQKELVLYLNTLPKKDSWKDEL